MPGAPKLDTLHAHSARVYNYWLGGKDNFAADRDAAEQAIAANPGIVADVRANREFQLRAVRFMASECGVRQFLDIGAGLPTAPSTHEVAQAEARDARIVYADNDPMVLLHAQALLSESPEGRTAYVESPAGQGGYQHPVPCRVQHHHRAGVHQAVDRGGLEPGGDPALAVGPDDSVGMPVGHIRRDARHREHGRRGGQAGGAVDAARQGYGRSIIAPGVAAGLNPPRTASASSSCPAAARIERRSGGVKPRPGIGSSTVTGWEESGRPHPARTALNLAQPS